MNNIIEQDHRFVKKRVVASQGFRSAEGALSTIAGYEAMNIIRKGQIRWLDKDDVRGQKRFIERLFGLAAWQSKTSPARQCDQSFHRRFAT